MSINNMKESLLLSFVYDRSVFSLGGKYAEISGLAHAGDVFMLLEDVLPLINYSIINVKILHPMFGICYACVTDTSVIQVS
jgi:hypothetical protein